MKVATKPASTAVRASKSEAQSQLPSAAAATASTDPRDYVWGTLTPQHQQQLFGQLLPAFCMPSTFLPGPMPFQVAPFFPGCCPPAPWMMPFMQGFRPLTTCAPACAPPADAMCIPTMCQKRAEAPFTSTQKPDQVNMGKSTGCGMATNISSTPPTKDASSRLNVKSEQPSIDAQISKMDIPAMAAFEPLDADDIRNLFQDDLFKEIQGYCFSESEGSDDTCCHNSASPRDTNNQQLSGSVSRDGSILFGDACSPEGQDAFLSMAAFDQGFEQDIGFTNYDSFAELRELIDMDDDQPLAAIMPPPAATPSKTQQPTGKGRHGATPKALKVSKAKGGVAKAATAATASKPPPVLLEASLEDMLGL